MSNLNKPKLYQSRWFFQMQIGTQLAFVVTLLVLAWVVVRSPGAPTPGITLSLLALYLGAGFYLGLSTVALRLPRQRQPQALSA